MSTSEAILAAARDSVQAHGFGGLNFRDLAAEAGIKPASIYHHFPSKADLGTAVAKRYWEDAVARLEDVLANAPASKAALHRYPDVFGQSLERKNRFASAVSCRPNLTICQRRNPRGADLLGRQRGPVGKAAR